MKRISIKKNNIVTNQVEMEVAAADEWLQKHLAMKTFGEPARSYEHEITPAVYEDQEVVITPAVTEQQEIFDGQGNSFDPPQYETVVITPAVTEIQSVLITPAVTETVNVPAEYEVVEEDITAEVGKKQLIEEKIAKGAAAKTACENVLNLIAGFNLDRLLTAQQISDMQALFSNIESALRASRPTTAKALIQAMTPDEDLVTTEMKELCIELLSNY